MHFRDVQFPLGKKQMLLHTFHVIWAASNCLDFFLLPKKGPNVGPNRGQIQVWEEAEGQC